MRGSAHSEVRGASAGLATGVAALAVSFGLIERVEGATQGALPGLAARALSAGGNLLIFLFGQGAYAVPIALVTASFVYLLPLPHVARRRLLVRVVFSQLLLSGILAAAARLVGASGEIGGFFGLSMYKYTAVALGAQTGTAISLFGGTLLVVCGLWGLKPLHVFAELWRIGVNALRWVCNSGHGVVLAIAEHTRIANRLRRATIDDAHRASPTWVAAGLALSNLGFTKSEVQSTLLSVSCELAGRHAQIEEIVRMSLKYHAGGAISWKLR